MLFEVCDEFFEILDGHAPRRAAAGDASEVGGMQTEFVHARFHARRHVARAGGIRGHRQSANGWFDMPAGFDGPLDYFGVVTVGRSSGWIVTHAEAIGVFLGDFQISEHRADGITFVQLDQQLFDLPAHGEETFIVALLVSTSMMSWSAATCRRP